MIYVWGVLILLAGLVIGRLSVVMPYTKNRRLKNVGTKTLSKHDHRKIAKFLNQAYFAGHPPTPTQIKNYIKNNCAVDFIDDTKQ